MTSPEAMPGEARGPLVAEGKTKRIYELPNEKGRVVVEYKNDITAFDDPMRTRQFETKAKYSNTINARVFEMLNRAGIPTAFVRQKSETEFVAEQCVMVPLEVVARRYAVGSYLSRHPEFKAEGSVPHRFATTVVELFLKTTKGSLKDLDGNMLVEGLDPASGEEDPYIPNPLGDVWELTHPKKRSLDPEAPLGKQVESTLVLRGASIEELTELTQKAFTVLEAFFEKEGFHFIDFKIEFGITPDGRLVIADVIDNDSWRLRDQNWNDVSKQSFRDGEDMATIEDKYQIVAALLEKSKTS
jgi:phosphoribosylaminoimidazole-succinocarboxamide synthase